MIEDKYFDIDYMRRHAHDIDMIMKQTNFEQNLEMEKQINRNNSISSVVRFSECKCDEECKHLDCSVIKCKQGNKK